MLLKKEHQRMGYSVCVHKHDYACVCVHMHDGGTKGGMVGLCL